MNAKRCLKSALSIVLTFALLLTNSLPNVKAAEEVTYSSNSYTVDGVVAYSYNGQSITGDGYTRNVMDDNPSLAKALYYSYGSLGYSKVYEQIDEFYLDFDATCDTDKLAISEMALTSIKNNNPNAMGTKLLSAIKSLPDYNADVFVPYYIYNAEREIVGYTSTSSEGYSTPHDTLSDEDEEDASEEEEDLDIIDDEGDLLGAEFNLLLTDRSMYPSPSASDYASTYTFAGGTVGCCIDHSKSGDSTNQYMKGVNESDVDSYPQHFTTNHESRKKTAMSLIFGPYTGPREAGQPLSSYYPIAVSQGGLTSDPLEAQRVAIITASVFNGKVSPDYSSSVRTYVNFIDNNAQNFYWYIDEKNTHFTNTNQPVQSTDDGQYWYSSSTQLSQEGSQTISFYYSNAAGTVLTLPAGWYAAVTDSATTNPSAITVSPGQQLSVPQGKYVTFFFKKSQVNITDITNKTIYFKDKENGVYNNYYVPPAGNYQPLADAHLEHLIINLKLGDVEQPGRITLKKTASSTACIDNGTGIPSSYSIAGAKYIFVDGSGQPAEFYLTETVKAKLTGNINGKTGTYFTTNTKGEFTFTFNPASYGITDETQIGVLYPTAMMSKAGGTTQCILKFSGSEGLVVDAGTYSIQEAKASPGYLLDRCHYEPALHKVTVTGGDTKSITCKETPASDPIKLALEKVDSETGVVNPLGASKLAGAVFSVKYYDGYYNFSSTLGTPKSTWYIKTDTKGKTGLDNDHLMKSVKIGGTTYTSSDLYVDSSGEPTIPLGTVVVKEEVAPEGYLTTWENDNSTITAEGQAYDSKDKVMYQIKIDDAGEKPDRYLVMPDNKLKLTSGSSTWTQKFADPIERGDMAFTKIEYKNGEPMKHIAFWLKSMTTGEKHMIVTDDNGRFSTKVDDVLVVDGENFTVKNTYNTNGNDNASHSDIYNNKIRPTGIWFAGKDGADSTVTDDRGSLPYDKYVLIEIPSKNTLGTQMITEEDQVIFEVKEDGDFPTKVVADFENERFQTSSMDAATHNQVSTPQKNVTIIDTVSYQFLRFNHTYTFKGVLVARDDFKTATGVSYKKGEPIKDDNGNYIMSYKAFTTEPRNGAEHNTNANGSVPLTYTFDAATLKNARGVWLTYLSDGNDPHNLVLNEDGTVNKTASNVTNYVTDEFGNEVLYIESVDLADASEYVDFISLETDAFSENFQTNVDKAGKDTQITDDVFMSNLIEGNEYKLVTHLVNRKTGARIKNEDGTDLEKVTTFTYKEDADIHGMVVSVVLPKFDSTPYVGIGVVVTQELYWNEELYLTDNDLTNERETIFFPEIGTEATNDEGTHVTPFVGTVKFTDTVTYTNLAPGKEYKLTGTLHYIDKDGKEQTVLNTAGDPITATTTFTPTEPDGVIEVVFEFNTSDILGPMPTQTVVFEDLEYNNVQLCTHADIEDEGQEMDFPVITTSLREDGTNTQYLDTYEKEVTLIDTVKYEKLEKGKSYTMIGKLINKDTGLVLLDKDGNQVTGRADFVAAEPDGTVTVEFKFDGSTAQSLIGEDGHVAQIVAFEYLYDALPEDATPSSTDDETFISHYEGYKIWAAHTNIEDIEQTITGPTGGTTLTDAETGSHTVRLRKKITVVDKVAYKNLIVGNTYTATGTLYTNKESATAEELKHPETDANGVTCYPVLDANGNKITKTVEFTAEKPDGYVEVIFEFEREVAETHTTIVAFEEISVFHDEEDFTVFVHADIEDDSQTIWTPSVHTTALSEDTQDHIAPAYPVAKIIDTVEYTNLVKGYKYKLVGTLYDKYTTQPLLVNGEQVTSTVEFEPEGTETPFNDKITLVSGTQDVIFTFDSTAIAGKSVVVFEKLYEYNADTNVWNQIGGHEDISDEGQTVHISELHTNFMGSNNSHQAPVNQQITLTDTVMYKNLVVGKKYTVKGILMLRPQGEDYTSVLDKVTGRAEKTVFGTFEKSTNYYQYDENNHTYVDQNGYVCHALLIDGKPVTAEATFTAESADGEVNVVFTFYAPSDLLAGRSVVCFEDAYSDNVRIGVHADITDEGQTVEFPPGNPPPKTSDEFPLVPLVATAVALAVGMGIVFFIKRRRKYVTK